MTNFIGYQINGKIFYNAYLAHYESFNSGAPVYFNCLDEEYDKLDWTQDPAQNFEELMDAHARYLRDNHERLILLWSGGTDSHTIYNVFKRNNLHIDEIIIKHSNINVSYPDSHVDWMINNHWDPTTIITPIDEYDTQLRSIVVKDEDWIWNNSGDMWKYGQSSIAEHINFLCNKNHSGHRWLAITGQEKPNIIHENGRWYSRHSDRILKQLMGHTQVHSFFLEPMINLKQSHLAKKALKKLYSAGKTKNWSDQYENRTQGELGYQAWARATGRHQELNPGVSYYQKQVNIGIINTRLNTDGRVDGFDRLGEPYLLDRLKQQDPTALTYVRGLYNLQSEKRFYEYMNAHGLDQPNAVFRVKQTWSKSRDLGP